jgi:hypothetical protein
VYCRLVSYPCTALGRETYDDDDDNGADARQEAGADHPEDQRVEHRVGPARPSASAK